MLCPSDDTYVYSCCRPAAEWQLRGPAEPVPDERLASDGGERDPVLEDHRLRRVHRVRAAAGGHDPDGAGGRTRPAPGQGRLHSAGDQRDAGPLLLHHLPRVPHLRPGREAEPQDRPRNRLPRPVRRATPHPDGVLQLRLGRLLLGLRGRSRHRVLHRSPPLGGTGRRRLRSYHRRICHQDAQHATAHPG